MIVLVSLTASAFIAIVVLDYFLDRYTLRRRRTLPRISHEILIWRIGHNLRNRVKGKEDEEYLPFLDCFFTRKKKPIEEIKEEVLN